MSTFFIAGLIVFLALALPGRAHAQAPGQWTGKYGISRITPKVDSGDVTAPALPGTKVDVGANTQPIVGIGYGLTDHLSLELVLGTPYTHKLSGAGAIQGTGVLATVKVLPPTLFIQYSPFKPDAVLRPYLGVGVTYVEFADEAGSAALTAISDIGGPTTRFSIADKWTGTVKAGLVWQCGGRWYLDLAYSKTALDTDVRYSSGQTQQLGLDPQSVSIGLGYRF